MEKDKRKKKRHKSISSISPNQKLLKIYFLQFFSAAAIRLKKLLPILLYSLEDKKLNYSKVSL